jgi:hypothetical protein
MRKWVLKHDSTIHCSKLLPIFLYFRHKGRSDQTGADQKTGHQTGDRLDRQIGGQATYTGRQAAGRLMQTRSRQETGR